MNTSAFICVECGTPSNEPLFIEKSKGNIELTRCVSCSNVIDKYIEFELILIAIDIILHKIQAFRHILFNRRQFAEAIDLWFIVFLNVTMIFSFKYALLHYSDNSSIDSDMTKIFHLLLSVILEHSVFLVVIYCCIMYQHHPRISIYAFDKFYFRQIYLAISFPSLGKLPILLLVTWDHELSLIVLSSIFTVSLEYISLKCVTFNLTGQRIFLMLCLSVWARFLVKKMFFSYNDILKLGII